MNRREDLMIVWCMGSSAQNNDYIIWLIIEENTGHKVLRNSGWNSALETNFLSWLQSSAFTAFKLRMTAFKLRML